MEKNAGHGKGRAYILRPAVPGQRVSKKQDYGQNDHTRGLDRGQHCDYRADHVDDLEVGIMTKKSTEDKNHEYLD